VLRPAPDVRDFDDTTLLTDFPVEGSDYESELQT
jgi:hypothetical protein